MRTPTQKILIPKQRFVNFSSLLIYSLAGFFIACTPADSATSSNTVNTRSINESYENIPSNQYNLGEKAPEFSLTDLNGTTKKLSDFRGKFVVIHFATTWCPFCNAEAPYLEQIYQDYQAKGVEVLIVDVKEDKALVQEKLQKRFNLTFPVLLDLDGSVAASYAPEGVLPNLARDEVALASNLLLDKEGKIQFFSLLDSQDFDAELVSLQKRLNELL